MNPLKFYNIPLFSLSVSTLVMTLFLFLVKWISMATDYLIIKNVVGMSSLLMALLLGVFVSTLISPTCSKNAKWILSSSFLMIILMQFLEIKPNFCWWLLPILVLPIADIGEKLAVQEP